jgi:hypothetical protein
MKPKEDTLAADTEAATSNGAKTETRNGSGAINGAKATNGTNGTSGVKNGASGRIPPKGTTARPGAPGQRKVPPGGASLPKPKGGKK